MCQVVPHGDENAECCEVACRAAAMRVVLGDPAETVWCRDSSCHRLLRVPAGASGLADCLPYWDAECGETWESGVTLPHLRTAKFLPRFIEFVKGPMGSPFGSPQASVVRTKVGGGAAGLGEEERVGPGRAVVGRGCTREVNQARALRADCSNEKENRGDRI